MITKKQLKNEIKNCENLLKAFYRQMDQAEEENDEIDYKYFSKCAKEQEDTIEIFKWLIEKYCR